MPTRWLAIAAETAAIHRLYDALLTKTHRAERTEAGPGPEPGRNRIGPIPHPGPQGELATRLRGGVIFFIGGLSVASCQLSVVCCGLWGVGCWL